MTILIRGLSAFVALTFLTLPLFGDVSANLGGAGMVLSWVLAAYFACVFAGVRGE